jgi:hypothetical protein
MMNLTAVMNLLSASKFGNSLVTTIEGLLRLALQPEFGPIRLPWTDIHQTLAIVKQENQRKTLDHPSVTDS